MTEFPRHFEVVITPHSDQDVASLIEAARHSSGVAMHYQGENGDGTHTVEFSINHFSEHPVNVNAVRDAGFKDYVIHELQHQEA